MEAEQKNAGTVQPEQQQSSLHEQFFGRGSAWRSLASAMALAPAAFTAVEVPMQPAAAAVSMAPAPAMRSVERIATSAAAEAWRAAQIELAANTLNAADGRKLIDASIHMSAGAERTLGAYVGQRDAQSGFEFKRVNEDGYKFAFVRADGETWYLSEAAWYRDQYPQGMSFTESSFVVWKKGTDKLTQKEFDAADLFSTGSQRIKFDGLKSIMSVAEANRKSEDNDAAGVRGFSAGRERIGYVGLVDPSVSDPIMAAMQDDTRYFPQFMNSLRDENGEARYNYVAHNGSDYVAVRSSPRDLLRGHVRAMYDEGVRSFHVVLNGHGNSSGVFFGSRRLSPQELHSVFSEFDDCKFVVDSIACFGGGIAGAMKAYQDPTGQEGRVFIKLQAKPFGYNQEGRIDGETGRNGAPKAYSSYYNIFHTYYLSKGAELGEAHWQADRAAKRFISCDAEGWLSGPRGGSSTMSFEQSGSEAGSSD